MGNCCKKKIYIKAKNEIMNTSDFKDKNNLNNIDNNKEKNAGKITFKEKKVTKVLIIKKNKGKKNFKEEEKNKNKNNSVKINIQNNIDDNDYIDSKTKLKRTGRIKYDNDEYSVGKTKMFISKIDKNYKNIILNYLLLHEKLNTQCNLKVYIINKKDNDNVIKLYNEIIKSNEYQLNAENKSKEKILEEVIGKSNIREFNKNIKFYSYEECVQLKDELIDLVDSTFCKDLGIKENESLKAIYINEDINSSNKIIEFSNGNMIKVEKRNEQYFLREALEDKDNIPISNLDLIDISINSDKNKSNNNIRKSYIFDITNLNNRFSLKSQENNNEDFNFIIFKIVILFVIQNKSLSKNERKEVDLKNDNNYYYLMNKNIIMNLIKEINEKNEENIIILLNNFLKKQNYQKFEEYLVQLNNIVNEFKIQKNNLFENKYNFIKIDQKELNPNINKKIDSLNNKKILYPSDFILVNYKLYELITKIINFEGNDLCDNLDNNMNKYSLLIRGKHIYLKNINKEENIIYICDKMKNEIDSEIQNINMNVSYILIFNDKEYCSNEYKLLISDGLYDYISKRELKNSNEPQTIINNKKEEIGIFINLQKINDLMQENEIDEINNDNNEDNIQYLISEERQDSIIQNEENEKKIIGLRNLQLNSYANSLLQCLYHIPPLTKYFISSNSFSLEENNNEQAFKKNTSLINFGNNSWSYKYYEVINHLYCQMDGNEKINSYYPINFLNYIQEVEPSFFKPNKESNPKNLLFLMIDNLKKELNKKENIKKLGNISSINFSVRDNSSFISYQNYLNNFMYENNSIIDKNFAGIQCKILSCQNCNHLDYDFNCFYLISFSLSKIEKKIEPNSKINLDICFDHYYNKEKSIKYSDKYQCYNCNNNGMTYYKQIYLSPKILILILDEVDRKGNLFDISLEININNYLYEKNEGYELIGCISYSREKGKNVQYISYCKNNEDGNWYCLYDECIYKIEPKTDMKSKDRWPYILFFKAKE